MLVEVELDVVLVEGELDVVLVDDVELVDVELDDVLVEGIELDVVGATEVLVETAEVDVVLGSTSVVVVGREGARRKRWQLDAEVWECVVGTVDGFAGEALDEGAVQLMTTHQGGAR